MHRHHNSGTNQRREKQHANLEIPYLSKQQPATILQQMSHRVRFKLERDGTNFDPVAIGQCDMPHPLSIYFDAIALVAAQIPHVDERIARSV